MWAMDYISSRDICYLVCDILSLIDKRPIEHGMRVAYMLMKLLQNKKNYEEYEIAEFAFLAMIHDIGAYVTGGIADTPEYENEDSLEHGIYGALFVKTNSPFGQRGEALLYHHMRYSRINCMNYQYDTISMYLSLLEDVDALYMKDGDALDYRVFEKETGTKYFPEAVMFLLKGIRRDNIFAQISSGNYKKELYDFMDYTLFTNEEKEAYVRFAVHCMGLREKHRAAEAIMCACVSEEIADAVGLGVKDREKLFYSALLHDMGMLAVDKTIEELPRSLEPEEKKQVMGHVLVQDKILRKWFLEPDIPDIIRAHHERLDGSGYPAGKRGNNMTMVQKILQVADMFTAMSNKRPYRPARKKEEIFAILEEEIDRGRIDDYVVAVLKGKLDTIERKLRVETKNYLEMQLKMGNMYKLLLEKRLGEKL